MGRRSSGLVGAWAEAQRREEMRRQAAHRAWQRDQREFERARVRGERAQQAAYRQGREAEARRRTEEIEARVAALGGLLVAGCAEPPFRPGALRQAEELEPFAPGALAQPVAMPDPARYQPQAGWGFGAQQRQAEARARFERDWQAAVAAEEQRQRQLAAYREQYDRWAAARRAEIRRHNAGIAELEAALGRGEPEAVVEYFSAALYAGAVWPEGFPRRVTAAFDAAGRRLVLDWELPRYEVVPAARAVRYVVSADEERETARPAGQRRGLYREVLAQCVLLVLRDVFAADAAGVLESVVVNGLVEDRDPATGRRARIVLASVMAGREAFSELLLEEVSAVDCLVTGLGGRLSARPDQGAAVAAGARPGDVGEGRLSLGEDDPDLLEMDPVAFEGLVAELFRARGMRAVTTQRSNDGGVDVEAVDPDPISGGRLVVQVKRYRGTVPPTAVRDLYGTVQSLGANKGILVTTSGFGPGSYAFAEGKPLTLIGGTELVGLLAEAGLPGRLGGRAGSGGATAGAGAATAGAGAGAGAAT
ncbi:restriction endonuclease, partial [Streptomyces sp. DSM 44917]